jgi:glycosyltransferase involved in cell wall biosynthesis
VSRNADKVISVLHLITTLKAGGAQTMLANVVKFSQAGGRLRHVVLEMTEGGESADRIRDTGAPVHSLGMKRGRASAGAVLRFVSHLRRERPAVVQTWLYHADLLGLLALPVRRVPVVWNIRSSWHYGLKALAPRACARLSALPTAVIVNSHAGRQVHEALGYRPRRWCHIGNGFDLELFKPDEEARVSVRAELGLDGHTPLVGLIGRWDPHKDHQTFLAGAGLLKARHPDVHFLLAGEGVTPSNSSIVRIVAESGLGACVHLLGSRTDVPRITAALDVAACTSVGEGFPNVVGEAMSAGVPCVSTDVGDAALLVGDRDMIVPTRNAEQLATAWCRLLSMDAVLRRKRGLEARARISAKYSLAAVVQQYEALYRELAS